MSEKRKDSKGRILLTGESQRKDGRYAYKYTDKLGKTQFIYAWKLVATDRTPPGKRNAPALRDRIKEIRRDLDDGIDARGGKITVCQLYEKYTYLRRNVKRNTEKGREQMMKTLKDDPLGARSIESVKQSDAKAWAVRMSEKGYAYQTIASYKRSLKAAFGTAIEDDYIRKNPFNFEIKQVVKDDRKHKEALTPDQEKRLLEWIAQNKHYKQYYDEVLILLRTGLRISEFCGLTMADIKNRCINVNHQLQRDAHNGFYVETPKTQSGIRQIPMTEEVYQAFQRVLKGRKKITPFSVDGYKDFLFLKKGGMPKDTDVYRNLLNGIVKKYNKDSKDPLPHISPHILRHTFCTRMAAAGMNPKTLQYIMGHSNISMTMDYYTHMDLNTARSELERLGGNGQNEQE